MVASFDPYPHELPSTYIVHNQPNKDELTRLTIQDQLITSLMGGVLPEQPDPSVFHDVLDIACGTGGWIIQAAQTYPTMSLVGIDISKQMINYATTQAELNHVTDQVKFQVMDAVHVLDFATASFDLVNLRLAGSFLRTWEWNKLVSEMLRITRPGGVIRITESEYRVISNSPALTHLGEMLQLAMFRSGHFFENAKEGLTKHPVKLLKQQRCQQVQAKPFVLEYPAGSEEWQELYEDIKHAIRTFRSFLHHWGCAPKDYDTLYQQILTEMKSPDFHATWHLVTAWGYPPNEIKTI
jgi:ubiquinone/menaquinone biosynthesis C-methylase UbiE